MWNRCLAACALLLLACGGDPRAGRLELTDSAGVTMAVTRGDDAAPSTWSVREELRIGGDEGAEETQFGRIADVDVDGAGNLYVLDQAAHEVRAFDAAGTFLRRIGSAGEGPGELGRMTNSVLVIGDTVLVPDWGQARLTRFTTDGTLIDTEPLLTRAGARSWWVRTDGRMLARVLERYVDEGLWRGHDYILAIAPDRLRADTLFRFEYPQSDLGGPGALRVPLIVNGPLWTPLPGGGIAWSTLDAAEIRVQGADGGLARIIRREAWQPRPIDDATRHTLVELLGQKMTQLGSSPAVLANFDITAPPHLPVLTALWSGPDGTLWAQRASAAADVDPLSLNAPENPQGFGGRLWDIFDAEGGYRGTIEFPAITRITRFIDNRIYGVQQDSLGVERVVRLRVESGS